MLLGIQQICSGQSDNPSLSPNHRLNCIEALKANTANWILDSIGTNGFRDSITINFLLRCHSFKGLKWDSIALYLGKPNFLLKGPSKFLDEGEVIYRYVLRSDNGPNNLMDTGARRLDIFVLDGIITFFGVFETDG